MKQRRKMNLVSLGKAMLRAAAVVHKTKPCIFKVQKANWQMERAQNINYKVM
jgi:hypothetical protein